MLPPDRRHFFSLAGALTAIAIACTAWLGWIVGSDSLKGLGGAVTMKPNAALGLMACGLSLVFVIRRFRYGSMVGAMLAGLAGAIGALTLLEHLSNANFGIDQVFFIEPPGARATMSPGRMGPNAAISLVLMAIALLSLRRDTRKSITRAQLCATAIALLAVLALTGYWYHAYELYDERITGIALPTALAFLALSAGAITFRADTGPIATFFGNRSGSVMARRLLPAAIGLPLLLGYMHVVGQGAGLYDTGFGSALFALVLSVAFVLFVWRTAGYANALDAKREQAEASLHATEASFATMLRALPVAVVLTDVVDGRILDANESFAEWSGYSRQELIGRTSVELGLNRNSQRRDDLRQRVSAGETVHSVELQVFTRSGQPREVLTGLSLVRLRGKPCILSTLIDITYRKDVEAQQVAARKAAESANHLKDEFLATLSHELRTPLNAILGYARMLRNDVLVPERRARAVEIIERNAIAQTQLVEDLLDVSRMTSGRLRLDMQPLEPVTLLHEALESIRPAAEAKGIVIDLHTDRLTGTVKADAARLRQVFWNLVSNAVKFTAPGGRVSVSMTEAEGLMVLTVTDTGIGISQAFLPHVFEAFRQADGQIAREHGGLGLGLAICKQLMELHGGSIAAGSEGIGHGSTFTIRLPLHRSTAVTSAAQRPRGLTAPAGQTVEPSSETDHRLEGIDVLVVDDQPDSLELLCQVLEHAGARVRTAATAEDALTEWSASQPQLLVADIGLPTMDGYELLRQIRATPAAGDHVMPAVAVTAHARSDDRAKALATGFQAHIAKPVDPDAFVAALVTVIQRYS